MNPKKHVAVFLLATFMTCMSVGQEIKFLTEGRTDTVRLGNNLYYGFVPIKDTAYNIVWGNQFFGSISKNSFEVLGNGTLYLICYNDNFIFLSQGCGTSCTYLVALPLISKTNEKIYMSMVDIDTINNLVAWSSPNIRKRIIVENLLNDKKHKAIKFGTQCDAWIECIDSTYFNKQSFTVVSFNKNKKVKKIVDLKSLLR